MSIVQNIPCPACREQGHDARGTNMMLFADGARYCNRAHWHKNGLTLYLPPDSSDPVMDMEITGSIKYTVEQFNELMSSGKLDNPNIRAIALSGMRYIDKIKVATDAEIEQIEEEIALDKEYFDNLKVRNLVSRHIPGQIAKFYNVRVGLNEKGKVARHYYPVYDRVTGAWRGAKCRNLPKDFRYGHLGEMGADNLMFGQKQTQDVAASGTRTDILLLVGGECDCMAAQTMLRQSAIGSQWEDRWMHIWSPSKGECSISEIIANKEEIKKFKKIIVCFDNDTTGNKLNKSVAKLFRGKVYKLALPSGCKDSNDALKQGRGKEFVNAWWNPIDVFEGGNLSSLSKYREQAKIQPEMGLSWAWKGMNPITYGIRKNYLSVWGAGTGVGKTKTTKEIVFHLAYTCNEPVVVIYLEEQPVKTVRSFAGSLINKDLTAPPCNDKDDPEYTEFRDYTTEQANEAIDKLCDDGLIMIGDLEGRKDVASVMEVMEEALAMGYQNFIIDNLTAFEHKGKDSKNANKVDAIDETMKRLGTFKDEHEVFILLLSHLKKVYGERVTHEEGGDVRVQDFRGAGSITFWANDVWGIERNTLAEDMQEKCLTTFVCLKNRDVGYKAGSKVYARMDFKTGKLIETEAPILKDFDTGTGNKSNDEF